MDKRTRNFLNLFYRLAQIDLMSELEIFVCTRIYSLNKKNKSITTQNLIMESRQELTPTEIKQALDSLLKSKYLKKDQHDDEFFLPTQKFLKRFKAI